MQAFLLDRVLEDRAPRPKSISMIRMNDDMVLLFNHNPEMEQYKYITGKASNGKTYIGIMPFGEVYNHGQIVNAIMKQFDAELADVKGGWAMFSGDLVIIYGHSTYYPQADHETVEKAIKSFIPEIDPLNITIKPSKLSPLS